MSDEPSAPGDNVAWRLEAFDARAGLAFAVWRGERNPEVEPVAIDWPCLYFAPPGFTPEPVGDVALALGASRGSFLPGLLIGGREASFRTPEEVAEFVRRAYVGGAGGDGGDGDEGPPDGGGGEPDGPRGPDRDLEPGDGIFWNEKYASGFLRQGVIAFEKRSSRLEFGAVAEFSWQPLQTRDGVEPLVIGALGVMQRLFAQKPSMAQTRAWIRWVEDAQILGGCLARIGLWSELWFGTHREALHQMLQEIDLPHQRGNALDPMEKFEFLFFGGWPRHRFGRDAVPQPDPAELLRRLPAPTWAGKLVGEDAACRSLFHVLSSFIASPQLMLSNPIAVYVVLFASASLVTCASPWPVQPWLYDDVGDSKTSREAVQVVAEQSFDWLMEHLPSVAFSPGFEEVIERTRRARYGK